MDFEHKGKKFRTGKLSAFNQLHISRRLTPLLGGLATFADGDFKIIRADGELDFEGDISGPISALGEAIAGLKDEDVEYIINSCLDVGEIKLSGGNTGYAPLRKNGVLMYELGLSEMLMLTAYTIKENMEGFFSELPWRKKMQDLVAQASSGQNSQEEKTGS